MTSAFGPHVSEDQLEQYALNQLDEEQSAQVEEHLLVCPLCQDQLQEVDDFVYAFRAAAAQARQPAPSPWAIWKQKLIEFLNPLDTSRLGPAIGAIAVAALAIMILAPGQQKMLETYSIRLEATRGVALADEGAAPAGKRIQLQLELRGLPGRDSYHVEVVNDSGAILWSSEARPVDHYLRLTTGSAFRPGNYWVRIIDPAGGRPLLREFALRVK